MQRVRAGGVAAVVCVLLGMASPAAAEFCMWTGQGTTAPNQPDPRWSNLANWTDCGGMLPGQGGDIDSLIFPGGALQPANQNDIPDLSVAVVRVLGNGAGNIHYDISGEQLGVIGGLVVLPPDDGNGVATTWRTPLLLRDGNIGIGQVEVFTGATLLMTGAITGDFIVKIGAGTLVLHNPANAWINLDIQDGGTVLLAANNVIPDAGAVVVENGTFDLNGFTETIGSLDGGTTNGALKLGAGTLTITQTTPLEFKGVISGSGNLIKNGNDLLILSGIAPNTYTGTTTINAGLLLLNKPLGVPAIVGPIVINGGTLQHQHDLQLSPDGPQTIAINGTGVWDLTGRTEAIDTMSGTGDIRLRDGTLVLRGPRGIPEAIYSGAISGLDGQVMLLPAPGFTGTMVFAGNNTYTGLTNVVGALAVTGNVPGPLSVTGSLAGTGIVGPISAGLGFIKPGMLPGQGILHAASLELTRGELQITINGPVAGTSYNQLALAGHLSFGQDAASALKLTVNVAPAADTVFKVIDVGGAQPVTGTFKDLPEGGTVALGATGKRARISYRGGDGNDVVLTVLRNEDKPGPLTYYLSEGATGGFFDEDVLIANPNDTAAPVTVTFSTEAGTQITATRTVPARGHVSMHVDDIAGLEQTAASAQVTSDDGLPLFVERSMFWDASYYAGHTGSAVDQPSPDWFFAEGSQGFFNTFVLVINPNPAPADVTFTFLREGATAIEKTLTLGANTRLTLDAGSVPELVNQSFGIGVHATQPIMAERSMYFGTTTRADGTTRLWSGGHESAGVTTASTRWFLAEGATGGFFDTFVLLSNPQNAPATVTLQYLLDTGATVSVAKTIPANGRLTTNIEAEADQRLHNAAVSTVVTSDVPIIAERSMYWAGVAKPWGEGHNSFGVVDASVAWGLAEGRVGGPHNFHTYILLANPQATAAEVTVSYLREQGAPVEKTYVVPPTSRFTIDSAAVPELQDEPFGAIIRVTNGTPIIVERSLYWDAHGVQFSGGTNATGIRIP